MVSGREDGGRGMSGHGGIFMRCLTVSPRQFGIVQETCMKAEGEGIAPYEAARMGLLAAGLPVPGPGEVWGVEFEVDWSRSDNPREVERW